MDKSIGMLVLLASMLNLFSGEKLERERKSGHAMQELNSWQDALPYKLDIVAYIANSSYFAVTNDALGSDPIRYAFIDDHVADWHDGDQGLLMSKLITHNAIPHSTYLIDSQLKKDKGSVISLRRATEEEIGRIRNAIKTGKARFDYMDRERALKRLDLYIDWHFPKFNQKAGIKD